MCVCLCLSLYIYICIIYIYKGKEISQKISSLDIKSSASVDRKVPVIFTKSYYIYRPNGKCHAVSCAFLRVFHQFTLTEGLGSKSLLTTQKEQWSLMISHHILLQYLYQYETKVISEGMFVIHVIAMLERFGKDEAEWAEALFVRLTFSLLYLCWCRGNAVKIRLEW